ncbi:DNA-directed RNA polymerase III subunit RPC6-like [Macadamia integrifolia]|uniref:DNA-directed RNA polymerase III subunit RPC6-like n=1 Tax=Macadamia integrifolia TaxID=60698 RepID=UPI001C4F4835|nr:DNA-directed RNA polymerase III subunit RPC6-like [Macadamia integrifolia]
MAPKAAANLPLKRKPRGASKMISTSKRNPTNSEGVLYEVIRSKQEMGISKRDLITETRLLASVVTKSLKSLQVKNLIKQFVNIQEVRKVNDYYIAKEFEPSKELIGGAWYVEGKLDKAFIEDLKELCLRCVLRMKVATTERIKEMICRSGVLKVEVTTHQIAEILGVLVLENEIMEVRSTGTGEFASIPLGTVCYKKCSGKGGEGVLPGGAMASIPCGVCPRKSECTPNGIISPSTCVYFNKWLDF